MASQFSTFHNCALPIMLHVKMHLPFELNSECQTCCPIFIGFPNGLPSFTFQSRVVLSAPQVESSSPSGLKLAPPILPQFVMDNPTADAFVPFQRFTVPSELIVKNRVPLLLNRQP